MKDLLIATLGLWRLWPLGLAIGIGLGLGNAMDLAGARGMLPAPIDRVWERLHQRV
jgi:hypothetical protein